MILFLKKEKKTQKSEKNYQKNFRMNIYYIQKINTLKYIVSLIILNFVQKLSFLIFLNIRSGVISFGYPLGPKDISNKI